MVASGPYCFKRINAPVGLIDGGIYVETDASVSQAMSTFQHRRFLVLFTLSFLAHIYFSLLHSHLPTLHLLLAALWGISLVDLSSAACPAINSNFYITSVVTGGQSLVAGATCSASSVLIMAKPKMGITQVSILITVSPSRQAHRKRFDSMSIEPTKLSS